MTLTDLDSSDLRWRPRSGPGRALQGLLGWLYPPRCAACDRALLPHETGLCEPCSVTLVPRRASCCPACGAARQAGRCPACRAAPPPWGTLRWGYHYGGALARILRRFKYGRRVELAAPLAALLVPLLPPPPAVLVPVPSSRRALQARGFDAMGEVLRLAVRAAGGDRQRAALLRRVDHRPAQASLGPAARRALTAEAFRLARATPEEKQRVYLLDDVVTTGATLRAAADALRVAGVCTVAAIALARADPPGGTLTES
jgi:ComF family protein